MDTGLWGSGVSANDQFARVNLFLPQLKDALDRYESEPNWPTAAALCTVCAAIDGQEYAVQELLTNPAWSLNA